LQLLTSSPTSRHSVNDAAAMIPDPLDREEWFSGDPTPAQRRHSARADPTPTHCRPPLEASALRRLHHSAVACSGVSALLVSPERAGVSMARIEVPAFEQ
jgi:hypothetical protein